MTEIHALSGAYAVDALDDLERAAFERHLAECAECRAEVAGLREAAALIAETTTADPPPELRDRVLAGIATVRPLPPVVPAARPRRRTPRLLVAAAAAAVLLGAGTVVWQQPWAEETVQAPSVAQQVLTADDARSTTLAFPGGASAKVTRSDSVGRAVIETRDMPPPPDGRVYQLWLDQPGEGMVSAGVMPVAADQTLVLTGDAATATGAGITVEPAGGSTSPTTKPIALFEFARSDA
ncbi:anti-sigma factor [Nocardioides hungaricus]